MLVRFIRRRLPLPLLGVHRFRWRTCTICLRRVLGVMYDFGSGGWSPIRQRILLVEDNLVSFLISGRIGVFRKGDLVPKQCAQCPHHTRHKAWTHSCGLAKRPRAGLPSGILSILTGVSLIHSRMMSCMKLQGASVFTEPGAACDLETL